MTSRRGRETEPACVSACDVIKFLERHERHELAGLVRGMATAAQRDAQLYADVYRDDQRVCARLQAYEPRPAHESCTGVPPPESSD